MKFLSNPMAHYLTLVGIYFTMVLIIPPDQAIMNAYSLSELKYRFLHIMYALPFIGVWFVAFLAYTKLGLYAQSIKGSVEASGYQTLARGCGWLAYSLPLLAVSSFALYHTALANPELKPISVITTNYLKLLIPLVGFTILGLSSRRLIKQTKTKITSYTASYIAVLYILLGLAYAYFSLRDMDLQSIMSAQNVFFLPIWAIILTLTIPYLYSWFVGLLAAIDLIAYSKNLKGLLYRQALKNVSAGIATVILSSIAVQFITSLKPAGHNSSISAEFAIAYLIQLLVVAGYILIAIGANKLKRIEEV